MADPDMAFTFVSLGQVGIIALIMLAVFRLIPADPPQPALSTVGNRVAHNALFWFVSLIPAIGVVVAYLRPRSFLDWIPFSAQLLIGLLVPFLTAVLVAFLLNLLTQMAATDRKALLFAIPAYLACYYFYTFPLFWMAVAETLFPGDSLGAGYGYLLLGILSFFVTMVAWLLIAAGSLFGAVTAHRLGPGVVSP